MIDPIDRLLAAAWFVLAVMILLAVSIGQRG